MIKIAINRELLFPVSEIERSDFKVCFHDLYFSNRKACDLYPAENLRMVTGKHSGECEKSGFSPVL